MRKHKNKFKENKKCTYEILAGQVKLKALDIIFIPQWDENSIIDPFFLTKGNDLVKLLLIQCLVPDVKLLPVV